MATKLYLRSDISNQTGRPTDTASNDADQGHVGAPRLICMTMSQTMGAAATKRTWNYGTTTGYHYDLGALFISPPLIAQTLEAGEHFTFGGAIKGMAPPASYGQFFLRVFAYLWRPGVGWVATLSDADASCRDTQQLGADFAQEITWRTAPFNSLGADIEVKTRDRIVVEQWGDYQNVASPEEITDNYCHYWGGTDDTKADGAVCADPASFIQYSSDLLLAEDQMAITSANILQGARDVAVDDVNVGALEGGVEVVYERRMTLHEVDQRMGIQKVDWISRPIQIRFTMKEATLENLRIAYGLPSSALSGVAGTSQQLGVGDQSTAVEHTLSITGKGPGTDITRTITVNKAVMVDTVTHSYLKDGATVYQVTAQLLPDETKPEGEKYMIVRDTAGAFTFA